MTIEQDETNPKFGNALRLVGDGPFVFGTDIKYLNALLMALKDAVNDKYDYIEWWLCDATDDHKVWYEGDSKE